MTPTAPLEAPRLFHTMRCRNAEAMIAWLKDTLGFTERVVYRDGDMVVHAELAFGSSILMLGQHRDDAYAGRVGDLDARRTDAVYLAVDDPDALYERSRLRVPGSRRSCTRPTTAAATSPPAIRKAGYGVSAPTGRRRARSPCRVDDAGSAGASELDAHLRLHARAERVLDHLHLGDEVGELDQLLLGVAAGDDDMRHLRLALQEVDTSATSR